MIYGARAHSQRAHPHLRASRAASLRLRISPSDQASWSMPGGAFQHPSSEGPKSGLRPEIPATSGRGMRSNRHYPDPGAHHCQIQYPEFRGHFRGDRELLSPIMELLVQVNKLSYIGTAMTYVIRRARVLELLVFSWNMCFLYTGYWVWLIVSRGINFL